MQPFQPHGKSSRPWRSVRGLAIVARCLIKNAQATSTGRMFATSSPLLATARCHGLRAPCASITPPWRVGSGIWKRFLAEHCSIAAAAAMVPAGVVVARLPQRKPGVGLAQEQRQPRVLRGLACRTQSFLRFTHVDTSDDSPRLVMRGPLRYVSRMRCSAELLRSGAPLIRDRQGGDHSLERSRVCGAPPIAREDGRERP